MKHTRDMLQTLGYTHQEVAEAAEVSRSTVTRVLNTGVVRGESQRRVLQVTRQLLTPVGRPSSVHKTKDVSKTLTRALKRLGITQADVVEVLNMPHQTVSQYVNGTRRAPQSFIDAFNAIYNTRI